MLSWGISVIKLFQSVQNPVLTFVVKAVTNIGSPVLFVLFLPIFFWCINHKKGFELIFICMVSFIINTILKNTFQIPRPFINFPELQLVEENGFSMPSGHAQVTATFWLIIAVFIPVNQQKKRTVLRICLAFFIPFFVGLSRIYLGVHYPTDVIFGWILGYAIAGAGIFAFATYAERFSHIKRRSFKLLILTLFVYALNHFSKGIPVPQAILYGFTVGYLFLEDSSACNTNGSLMQKIARVFLGLGGAIAFLLLFRTFLMYNTFQQKAVVFLFFAFFGFWISYLVPKISTALKLTKK